MIAASFHKRQILIKLFLEINWTDLKIGFWLYPCLKKTMTKTLPKALWINVSKSSNLSSKLVTSFTSQNTPHIAVIIDGEILVKLQLGGSLIPTQIAFWKSLFWGHPELFRSNGDFWASGRQWGIYTEKWGRVGSRSVREEQSVRGGSGLRGSTSQTRPACHSRKFSLPTFF